MNTPNHKAIRQPSKHISLEQAWIKIQKYCAYQERCHQEVRNKLLGMKVYGDNLEEMISELVQEGFLNEERFARSYARGKFRMKSWGRQRIKMELRRRNISDYCVRKAMEEIAEEDYLPALRALLERKGSFLEEADPHKKQQKLAQYAFRRGWESELVWKVIAEFKR